MLYDDLLSGSHVLWIIGVAVAVSLCIVDVFFIWHIVVYLMKMYIVFVMRYMLISGQRISVFIGHDYRILMPVGIEAVRYDI